MPRNKKQPARAEPDIRPQWKYVWDNVKNEGVAVRIEPEPPPPAPPPPAPVPPWVMDDYLEKLRKAREHQAGAPEEIHVPIAHEPVIPHREVRKRRAYDRESYTIFDGYNRLWLKSILREGDILVERGYSIHEAERFNYEPQKTLEAFKLDNAPDYDNFWVYRTEEDGKKDERPKKQYICRVQPLPLP